MPEAWRADCHRDQQTTGRGTFVPLSFRPGEAFQFDWSEDFAVLAGERTKLQMAHIKLSHSRAFLLRAYPRTIRVDQGSEFVSRDLDLWAYAKGVTLDFSRPGKPTDNAFIEAFNSKFRSECLNAHWFMSLDDARSKMEDWRRYYNDERPHSGIGQKVPILLHNSGGASSPSLAKECSAPHKLDHSKLEFSAVISLAGRSGHD
jgi:hypothetical protein